MARITIREFSFSERAVDKFWRNGGIVRRQVEEILFSRIVIMRNRKDQSADYLVIGRDANGNCVAVPVFPTEDPFVWRPVTAWYCKKGEGAKLR